MKASSRARKAQQPARKAPAGAREGNGPQRATSVSTPEQAEELRRYRNRRLYRSLARILREYNRRLIVELEARGFTDFSPAFPQFLSNLDTEGTRIGVLALRAGVTRQAAGKFVMEIESCGYVARRQDQRDARATMVTFTARGRQLLAAVLEIVECIEGGFAELLGEAELEGLREGLFRIAQDFDPAGALGAGDREATTAGFARADVVD
jgi:DNA-binding MarR family transcriptional regulator